ncbi:unnamed protein product [Enterobius vermicularis]|uniref:AAA_12 domain-containing protein n=1 Tax=Enterobius vermicularis TaxID=51028 RepID=A0A158Q9C8_ENTVE|nr:unnamed protein product [Enterobius vermicularis]
MRPVFFFTFVSIRVERTQYFLSKMYLSVVFKATSLDTVVVGDIKDVYSLPREKRWMLYRFWCTRLQNYAEERLKVMLQSYKDLTGELKQRKVSCENDIIGATTTGAAKSRAQLNEIGCPVVIAEEAAAVLEAHLVVSIPLHCKHAILIGDHQQLRPNPAVYEMAKEYNLEISLFERMVRNSYPYKALLVQHRMSPLISDTLMKHFYPELENGSKVFHYPSVRGTCQPLFFISHKYPENQSSLFCHQNEFEADFAVSLTNYFLQQHYGLEEVTILCAYLAQAALVKRLAKQKFNDFEKLVIETVDAYQGKENNIIIFSAVRSIPSASIGFLAVPNRVCVALSRARYGFYMIGNMDVLTHFSKLWRKICNSLIYEKCIEDAFPAYCAVHDRLQVIFVDLNSDFLNKTLNGGCDIPCGFLRQCGHYCRRTCHNDDLDHMAQCDGICEKLCKNKAFMHPCAKKCGQVSSFLRCFEAELFPCGHTTGVVCYLYDTIRCKQKCEKTLDCGHLCSKKCCESCDCDKVGLLNSFYLCYFHLILIRIMGMRRRLACGHEVEVFCGRDSVDVKCTAFVEKKFVHCGHSALVRCSEWDSAVCDVICGKQLPFNCGHRCISKCGICCPKTCNNPCSKLLPCGHPCQLLCGEPCKTDCDYSCENESPLLNFQGSLRRCKDPCIFCLEACATKGCGKRCWEPCNFVSSISPCLLCLECGHRCLGLESEKCPGGVFQTNLYLLKPVESGKRVIQFESCKCVLLVEVGFLLNCGEKKAFPRVAYACKWSCFLNCTVAY